MYKFTDELNEKEYEKFVKDYSMASFMQDYNWAYVKDNWTPIHCGLYKNKSLVAVCTILKKKLIKNICMFYIPRGYLIDYENYEILNEMTNNIKKLAKKHHAYMVKLDPNYCTKEYSFKDIEIPINYSKNNEVKNNNLRKCGYKFCGIKKDMRKSFQPQYNVFTPTVNSKNEFLTDEELLKTYASRLRSYLNGYISKRGITYEYTTDEKEIDSFVKLLKDTEKKQNINLRNKEYFEKMIKAYKGYVYLFFGTIDLNKYLEFLLNNKGNDEEISLVKDLLSKEDKVKLSTALVLLPKNEKGIRTSEYLYAGNSEMFTNLKASSGLVHEVIKFSRDNNCNYCNLGGVEGTLDDNLTRFKKQFNGVVMEFTGEYDLPTSILYYPIKLFYPILLKLYRIILRKQVK